MPSWHKKPLEITLTVPLKFMMYAYTKFLRKRVEKRKGGGDGIFVKCTTFIFSFIMQSVV